MDIRSAGPNGDLLSSLPALPGSIEEANAIGAILGASPSSVISGDAATEARLDALSASGKLAAVQVLEFATHALVAEPPFNQQPALALANTGAFAGESNDGFLSVSEASSLKLNADWVILSACNTGSPDTIDPQGLSGFARAFFHAGTKRLLVSNWTVRDATALALVPRIFALLRTNPSLSAAEAVQKASLALLDDPNSTGDIADWGAFSLVGEPRHP